jgi:hypothetical protein
MIKHNLKINYNNNLRIEGVRRSRHPETLMAVCVAFDFTSCGFK